MHNSAAGVGSGGARRPALLAALLALALTTLAPGNAAAQTTCPADPTNPWPDNTLCLGTVSSVNLNLVRPITLSNGKVYYYLDRNNSGGSSNNDDINHNQLSAMLNGGNSIADTQTGGHDGTDDARSIIIGIYTVILPTLVELRALITDQSLSVPTGWGQSFYHTSTATGATHTRTTLQSLTSSRSSADNTNARVAFQVISSVTLPTLTPITDQTYVVGQDVTFTLPESIGGASPFTYTLTPAANIPDGLVFTPADRTLAGAPTAAAVATTLTYTVTDSAGNTASQTFSVTITEPLLFDGTIANQSYVIGETVDLTLPEATGGMTPYSYTLLRNNAIVPPATGLTFDPNNRTLKGIAAVVFAEGTKPAAVLVYTVTDSSSPTASAALTFTARINAAPLVSLVLTPASIAENGGVSTFTATLNPATSGITTVTITATPDTGTATGDFSLSGNTLTFADSATTSTGTVTLAANDNNVYTGDKTITISATVDNGVTAPADVTLTISEDEAAPIPVVTLLLTPLSIAEGGVGTVTATINPASTGATMVTVTAAPTTGATADDFTLSANTTLTIADGATASTGTVTITAAPNDVDSPDKIITVSASAANSITADVSLAITDDDDTPTVTLELAATSINEGGSGTSTTVSAILDRASSEDTVVTITAPSGGNANDYTLSAAPTLTIAAGDTTTTDTVTITATDNSVDADSNKVSMVSATASNSHGINNPTAVTLTIVDDEGVSLPPQAQIVPAGFGLKPADVAAGGSFRLLFVTSQTTDATSTDIESYNTHVKTSAAGGHADIQAFSSEFRAIVSTQTMNARDNTSFDSPGSEAPVYWLNGNRIVPRSTVLFAATWLSTAATNQNGASHTNPTTIWTGSNANGTSHTANFMGSATPVFGSYPAPDGAIQSSMGTNSVSIPLYALSPLLTLNRAPTVANAIPDQSGSAGTALTYTFPDTTFADGDSGDTLAYSFEVTPAAAWLEFDADTRTFSGMPPATGLPANGIFTITVTASDGTESVTDEFTLTIAPALGLSATIDDQIYTATQVIDFTLPAATGGTATYNYALTPTANLPTGLSFTAGTRTIAGSPSAAAPAATLTYTVTDSAATPSTFVATFDITVNAAPTITFSDADDQTYTVGVEIPPLLLPEAVGGTAPLTYRAVDTPPAGLTFSAANRNLIGTPTEANTFSFRFQATDANGISSDMGSAFEITINKGTQAALTFAVTNVDATFGGAAFTQAATGGSGSGTLTYESSDTAVATVDANGEVTIVGGGTTTITATKEADDNYLAATATYTVTVAKAAQAAFSAGADQTMTFVANATFTQAATGGSGTGDVTYESNDTAVATVNSTSGEVTLVGAGSATITARKAADDDYLEASDTYLLTISKGTQVGFSAGTDRNANVGDAAITQAASGGSGNGAVTYESSDAAVATVAGGGVVSIVGVGTATITATKEADDNYLVATDTYMLTVGKGTQAAFSAGSDRTATFVAGATFTQEASGGSGTGAVTYESSDAAVATVAGGGVVTLVGVGTATITATKEADANYLVATATYMLTVEKGPQVNFDAGSNRTETFVANATFTQEATGGSGNGAVTYESSDTAVATVASGGVVTLVAVGSATITATKAADDDYNEATDSYILTVTDPSKTDQTGFSAGADQTMTFVAGATFTQAATGGESDGAINYASSDLDVATVATGGVVSIVGAGFTVISATKVGNATYNDITDSYDLTVSKGTQVAFSAGADQTMTFGANATFTQAATGGSGSGAVTYMSSDTAVATVAGGGVVTIIAGGTTIITATKDEDDDYLAATDSYILSVGKADQVGFSAGADQTLTFAVTATFTQAASGGNGGGAVTYMSSDTAVATVASGGVVSIVGAGTATITAEKAADADYNVATDTYMLTVNKGTQVSINAGADRAVSVGDTFTQPASGGSGTGALTYASSDTAVATVDSATGEVTIISVGTGTATITATQEADANYNEASDSYILTVSKGAQVDFSAGDDRTETFVANATFTQPASGGSGNGDVTYASNNDPVATVDSATGEVTLVAIGTATITATKETDDDYLVATDSYELTVNAKTNQAAFSAGADRTETFVANATFTQAATGGSGTGAVTYASSNTAVATVASGGVVTLVSVGTTTITATKDGDATYNEATASYSLTVSDPAKTDQAAFSAGADRTETFVANATFTQAATGGSGTGAVTYASSNTAVATVASGGVVTLVAVGTATITATKDGDATYNEIVDSYILTVSDPAKTDQAAFSAGADRTETFAVGATFTQAATGGSGTGAVSYTSSNTAVATVASGGVVTLVSVGTTTITATKDGDATYNEIVDSYILTVSDPAKTDQAAFSAGADRTETFAAGATFTQAATGGSGTGAVTYASSNTAVATVASGGVVTIEAVGTTTITANIAGDATYNAASDSYILTVNKGAQVGFSAGADQTLTFVANATFTQAATGGLSSGAVTYVSSNTAVATVASGGVVTLVNVGTATITATKAGDPTYNEATATFNVTVVRAVSISEPNEIDIELNLDTADTGDVVNEGRLTLPSGHGVSTVTLGVISQDAVDSQPTGVEFALTIDIALTDASDDPVVLADTTPATVCLPTTDVPAGRTPMLYHYTSGAWNEIRRDTTTRPGFVCGTTTTFSPFAVGSVAGGDATTTARMNEQILTRASQAMTAGTLAAVAARVEAAADGAGFGAGAGGTSNIRAGDSPTLAYQFGGQSSMRGLLQAHGKSMLEGEMDYARLLDGASFVMPLSAAGDEGGGKMGGLSLWGGADFSNLDGNADDLDWDGEVVSFHLGVDTPVGNNMLAGLALSLNTASFDYTDNGQSGDYDYTTTNLHPYFGYTPNEKLNFWGAAGFGQGEIEIEEDNAEKRATDTTHLSLAGGFSNQILRAPGWLPDSVTTLNLKSDASFGQVEVEKDETAGFASQEIDSHHVRLLVSGEQRNKLAGGGSLAPSMEVGVRYDGGDGVTGSGVEVGTGVRYAHPGGKLTLAGNVRSLKLDGYDALGADFTVRLAPQSGRGLSLSLQPVWGQTQSTAERLWDEGAGKLGGGDTALQSRMDSEVGYGLAATMLGSAGVLTPYAGMTTADGGVNHLRLGGRFAGGTGLRLNLEGARENSGDSASNTVLLRGELAF